MSLPSDPFRPAVVIDMLKSPDAKLGWHSMSCACWGCLAADWAACCGFLLSRVNLEGVLSSE